MNETEIEVAPPEAERIYDPKHWRERAEQARAKAEAMLDRAAREAMMEAANDYDRLARQAETGQLGSPEADERALNNLRKELGPLV